MSDSDLHVMGEETEIPHTSPEDARKAARTIASFAQDADECRMLLDMLGLTGQVATCSQCGGPISRPTATGHRRAGAEGMCGQCFDGELSRRRRKAAGR